MTGLRLLRLSKGWEPTQLIGRMKIQAARDGVALPATYHLIRLLFLWENGRITVPAYYADLINRAIIGSGYRISMHWNAVEYRQAGGAA